MIPDNVEKIIMTKEDYGRNVEQLLVEKLKLEQELQRKDDNWNELKKYINKMIEKDKKYTDIASRYGVLNCKSILDKINELEKGR